MEIQSTDKIRRVIDDDNARLQNWSIFLRNIMNFHMVNFIYLIIKLF